MVFKARPAREEKRADSQTVALTFIGKGSEVKGDLDVAGNLRVDGIVRGNVRAEGDVEVSPGGVIEGKSVSARNIIVHGTVKATLTALEQLRIHSRGEVEGDVTAQSLDIESGARFVGHSNTGRASAQIHSIDQSAHTAK